MHLRADQLEAGLDHILASPKDMGIVELIVRRPRKNEREVIDEAELDTTNGLLGDNWKARGSRMTADGSSHPDMQINIMNARAIALVAMSKDRWPLAGDQLYLDLDLSAENLPPGTELSIGSAILQVTAIPHNGCKKFAQRFGGDATVFVNSTRGKQLHLRGINAKVVRAGKVSMGDVVRKVTR
jgi:hypothetical protein